jgi:hypothetical protein
VALGAAEALTRIDAVAALDSVGVRDGLEVESALVSDDSYVGVEAPSDPVAEDVTSIVGVTAAVSEDEVDTVGAIENESRCVAEGIADGLALPGDDVASTVVVGEPVNVPEIVEDGLKEIAPVSLPEDDFEMTTVSDIMNGDRDEIIVADSLLERESD